MGMSKENMEKNIKRLLSIIKPNGVLMIDFELLNDSFGQYFLNIGYILPDDTEILSKDDSLEIKREWNILIKNTIENYFGVNLYINTSFFLTETFYKKEKELSNN